MFVRKDRISPQMHELHEELKQAKVVPLFPISGGKFGDKVPWLRTLPIGTIFIALRKNGFTTSLDEYTILEKKEANEESFSLLRENRREGDKDLSIWDWHDDEVFSNEYKLKKVLDG